MGERVRTQVGGAPPAGKRGAPGPERESMSLGIREMILAWGEGNDPRDNDERLVAIRKGGRFVVHPVGMDPGDED